MEETAVKKEMLSSQISKILTTSNKSAVHEEIAIAWLDAEKANILTKIKIDVGGTLYSVGNEIHKGYENTENGRNELLENVKEPFLSAILAVWDYEKTSDKKSESLKISAE